MKSVLKLILVLGLAYAAIGYLSGPNVTLAHFDLESNRSGVDACETAERCVYVYLAPWCPSCTASIPLISEFQSYVNGSEGKVGMRIVVGLDSQEKMDNYAQKIASRVYFDEGGDFRLSMGQGSGVPFWLVVNSEGRGLASHKGTPTGGNSVEHLIDHLVDRILGLSEFI